jgi:predicted NAD/FAD-binding protein
MAAAPPTVQGRAAAPRRIGVVGGGISGLLATAELQRAGHDVILFEAAPYAGGHTNTIDVETEAGPLPIDTGFIVHNDRNYPNFERILAELGVATQPANMSFGVSDGEGRFEWAARGARGIFARPAHAVDPRFLRMLRDLVRFNREARTLLVNGDPGPSLRSFLADGEYSDYFVERLLVPQASAVWSADPEQMWSFPARFLAEFFDNHGVLQITKRPRWRSIPGGSRTYVEALTRPFADRIRLATPVQRVERVADGVRIAFAGGSELFDEVVIGAHSDQALAMVAAPTRAEREVLGAFPYQPNEAVLHTDTGVMPRRRSAWASWNFHMCERSTGRTTVTYDMNRLQSLEADETYLVTLNRTEMIDPGKIIDAIEYSHPVFTPDGMRAQARWSEISGADRIHYCGAYWRWGFHEDGAWSALRVSEALGGRGPGLGDAVEPAAGRSHSGIELPMPEPAPALEAA